MIDPLRMTPNQIVQTSVRAAVAALAVLAMMTGCATPKAPVAIAPPRLDQYDGAPTALEVLFDNAEPVGWFADSPESWQVMDGRYAALVRGDTATAAMYLGTEWRDGLFEADYIREPGTVGAGGLIVRATPDFQPWRRGSGYMFAIGSDGAVWHEAVFRQVNGVAKFLNPWTPIPIATSGTNRLAVVMQGPAIHFYINGEPRWSGEDRAHGVGVIGVFGTSAEDFETLHGFDSIRVRTKPVEPPPSVEAAPQATATPRAALPRESAGDQDPSLSVVLGPDRSPVLRPGLLVRVSVLVSGKREIDAEVRRVTDMNMLDLPLVGAVRVEGMTLSMLVADLQRRYQDFFINPQVTAEFVVDDRPDAISPWGSVIVLGRVRTPGRVNIPPTQDLTVSAAIQQAGGLDTSARASAIRVTRRTEDGKRQRITVDLSAIGQQGDTENDLLLRPGDLIFVPERIF